MQGREPADEHVPVRRRASGVHRDPPARNGEARRCAEHAVGEPPGAAAGSHPEAGALLSRLHPRNTGIRASCHQRRSKRSHGVRVPDGPIPGTASRAVSRTDWRSVSVSVIFPP